MASGSRGRGCAGRELAPALGGGRGVGLGEGTRKSARLELRIEHVAQAVADEIDADGEEEDDDAGNGRHMRRHLDEVAPIAEHAAEIGLRRLRAEPEEAQARRFEDHPADGCRQRDDDRRQHVGEELGRDDLEIAQAAKAAPPP